VIHLDGHLGDTGNTIHVPTSVRMINFWHGSGNVNLVIDGDTEEPLHIVRADYIKGSIHHKSRRPLLVESSRARYQAYEGAGPVFLEDHMPGGHWNAHTTPSSYMRFAKGQRAFGWSINPEGRFGSTGDDASIENQGGILRVVGLKYEGNNIVLRTSDGGLSDIFGAFVYSLGKQEVPAFESIDAHHSLAYVITAHGYPRNGHIHSVREIHNGESATTGGGFDQRTALFVGYFLNSSDFVPFDGSIWRNQRTNHQ